MDGLLILASFIGGAAGAQAPLLVSKLRPRRKHHIEDEDATEYEGPVIDAATDEMRARIIAHTMQLKDMAHSDDPFLQEAMQNMAKSFLLKHRGYFGR